MGTKSRETIYGAGARFGYLEVKCLGCNTHQTVALDIVRRPKVTPVHELERYMRCKDCSEVRGYPFKRSHLVALRSTKITSSDPPAMPSSGDRFGHVAKAQTIASVLAAQIRSQGFACDDPMHNQSVQF